MRQAESFLTWVTYIHLIGCFINAVGLFYPNAEIPSVGAKTDEVGIFFPLVMVTLLCFAFALHGYYLKCFFEKRSRLHFFLLKWITRSPRDFSLKELMESYTGQSAYESLFNDNSKSRLPPKLGLVSIFVVNHTLIVIDLGVLYFSEDLRLILFLVVSSFASIMVGGCYLIYFMNIKKRLIGGISSTSKFNRRFKLWFDRSEESPYHNEASFFYQLVLSTIILTIIMCGLFVCTDYKPYALENVQPKKASGKVKALEAVDQKATYQYKCCNSKKKRSD